MFKIPMRPVNLPRRLPDIRDYILQPKFDGWYVVFSGGRAYTRTGEDITSWACWRGFCPDNAVGEMMHKGGRAKIPQLAHAAVGLRVVLFDIPCDEPLETRLDILNARRYYGYEIVPSMRRDTWQGANELLASWQDWGEEGLVLKRRFSPWVSGDSSHWFRFKKPAKLDA